MRLDQSRQESLMFIALRTLAVSPPIERFRSICAVMRFAGVWSSPVYVCVSWFRLVRMEDVEFLDQFGAVRKILGIFPGTISWLEAFPINRIF